MDFYPIGDRMFFLSMYILGIDQNMYILHLVIMAAEMWEVGYTLFPHLSKQLQRLRYSNKAVN